MGVEGPDGTGKLGDHSRAGPRVEGLTTRPSTDDEFSDFIIEEDENAVGKCAEPPVYPAESKSWSVGLQRQEPEKGARPYGRRYGRSRGD